MVQELEQYEDQRQKRNEQQDHTNPDSALAEINPDKHMALSRALLGTNPIVGVTDEFPDAGNKQNHHQTKALESNRESIHRYIYLSQLNVHGNSYYQGNCQTRYPHWYPNMMSQKYLHRASSNRSHLQQRSRLQSELRYLDSQRLRSTAIQQGLHPLWKKPQLAIQKQQRTSPKSGKPFSLYSPFCYTRAFILELTICIQISYDSHIANHHPLVAMSSKNHASNIQSKNINYLEKPHDRLVVILQIFPTFIHPADTQPPLSLV
eukprot:TRINITY_DN4628_c0_g2_i4.p1 TRINITY_DN4628_c0_g2~~TRINITY_DN4628_c0_g2_i4.p1  ORF type:complete len:263 (-),score=-33.75 TRINITY_DN4628_c0_g2_i4:131-919(-)